MTAVPCSIWLLAASASIVSRDFPDDLIVRVERFSVPLILKLFIDTLNVVYFGHLQAIFSYAIMIHVYVFTNHEELRRLHKGLRLLGLFSRMV